MSDASSNLPQKKKKQWLMASSAAALLLGTVYFLQPHSEQEIDYNEDIRPIFNAKCISCHGGVKKQAGFSLLFREEALGNTRAGRPAIIPGDADGSELMRRLVHSDPEERMPLDAPALSQEEIDKIRRWIDQGAKWKDHWAFVKPQPVSIPDVKNSKWPTNGIDHFILQKLEADSLQPSPEADRATLIRRVSLDLTGLPPTPAQVKNFLENRTPRAYESLVDSLLASPHYGERWSALWLDLARFADSKGYEKDSYRNVWRYRDYVIRSFNEDKPFDKFTVEQLAGDLLPERTQDQLIATAYHRNTSNNDEGGTDDEEFRTSALIDRVSNTWEVWQGTTMACVQCHSHPYDPFRHEDFYKSMAFFNNTRDEDVPDESPTLIHFDSLEEAKIQAVKRWIGGNLAAS
jgi:mono/diheme cytochrome c family protein